MDFWVDNVRYTIEDCGTKTILDLLRKILDKGVSVYSSSLDSRLTDAEAKINGITTNLQTITQNIASIKSDITEISQNMSTLSSSIGYVAQEVIAARGGQASLDARLDAMTTATSNAASAASAAQTAAEEAQSTATTAQNTANEAATNANTANSNIAAAAGSFDSLAARLNDMDTDITEINNRLNDVDSGVTLEEYITTNNSNISKLQSDLQSVGTDISSIESDVAEISSGLTSVRSEVTTARGGSASLDARLDAMDTDITNVTDVADTATTDISEINVEITDARLGFNRLSHTMRAAAFSTFGKALNQTSKVYWMNYTSNVTNYYTASGANTTSEDPNAAYTIRKVNGFPMTLVISIANILTVTSDTLLASSLPHITVDGTLYTVFFIRLPNIEFNSNYSVNNAYLNTFPAIVGPSDPTQITMDMIGNTNSTGKIGLTTANANLYIPVLRPSTSPGTVFKFLYTAIDPDTNTVQYLTYNSGITVFL